MIKYKLTIITILSFMTIFISCTESTNSNVNDNKSTIEKNKKQINKTDINTKTKNEPATESRTQCNSKALEFLANLKTGEKLSSFFSNNWIQHAIIRIRKLITMYTQLLNVSN